MPGDPVLDPAARSAQCLSVVSEQSFPLQTADSVTLNRGPDLLELAGLTCAGFGPGPYPGPGVGRGLYSGPNL